MINIRRKNLKNIAAILFFICIMLLLSSCGAKKAVSVSEEEGSSPTWNKMEISGSMELLYAEEFSVSYYENGCRLIEISDGSRFLTVPESQGLPEGIDEDIVVLRVPVRNIYLAASAAMDHFCKLEALDNVTLSATKASGWHIPEARQAMEAEEIVYAGKYSTPDYELILEKGCELAVESTMILHTPEVKEQLEKTGIPVLVDRSSYERHPLGRSEWMKLYGVLTGREEQAEAVFREQADKLNEVLASAEIDSENRTEGSDKKSVAFFYITSSGSANVRKSGDYVSKMIELAGGRYVFDDIGDGETATATATIQMEDFYAGARDADYLIYNSTIDGNVETLDQLLQKNALLADFKAVRSGNVYVIGKNMYQETSEAGTIILDMHKMLLGDDEGMKFLRRLE